MKAPNGVTSFLETYYEVVTFINRHLTWVCEEESTIIERYRQQGHGEMYELAQEWTEQFEEKYEGEIWGETLEFYDVLEEFLREKNKK